MNVETNEIKIKIMTHNIVILKAVLVTWYT